MEGKSSWWGSNQDRGAVSDGEEHIKIDPFPIPIHWPKIAGADFGIDHPAAGCWLAIDRDADTVYVTDAYRRANEDAAYHAAQFNKRGKWIPVSWPHDGLQRGKGDGVELRRLYLAAGANMLTVSARYQNDVGGGQPVEPIVLEVIEMIDAGRFKVFSNLSEFFEEYRSLHRNDKGIIVPKRDDILKACFYALMMRRYARVKPRLVPKRRTRSSMLK